MWWWLGLLEMSICFLKLVGCIMCVNCLKLFGLCILLCGNCRLVSGYLVSVLVIVCLLVGV